MKINPYTLWMLSWVVINLSGCAKSEHPVTTPNPADTVFNVGDKRYTTADLLTAVQEDITFNSILTAWKQQEADSTPSPNQLESPTLETLLKQKAEDLAFEAAYAQKARDTQLDQSEAFLRFTNDIVRNELFEKLLVDEILSHISFTEEDLRNLYEQHKRKFKMGDSDRFVLSGMYVRTSDKPADEAWQKIQTAYDRLLTGEDFDAVSIRYSEAPFEKRGMTQEINLEDFNNSEIPRELMKLNDGEFSEIIPSGDKLLIYKRHQYIPPRYAPFQQVKDQVREIAAIEKRNHELALLNQELMEKYKPSVFPELLIRPDDEKKDVHILSLPGVFEMTLEEFLLSAANERKNSYQDRLDFLNIVVNKTVMLAEAYARGWNEQTIAPILRYHQNKRLTREYIRAAIQDPLNREDEFQQVYQANRDHSRFTLPKRYDLYYLFFPAVFSLEQTSLETENQFLRAREKAWQAYEELQNGAPFFEIVSKYSHNEYHKKSQGYLGKVTLKQLTPQRSDALRNADLQAGEFTQPQEIYQHSARRYGYEIYYVHTIEPERQMTFPEAKNLLLRFAENKLYNEYYETLRSEWESENPIRFHATALDQVQQFLIDIAQKADIQQAEIYRYTLPNTLPKADVTS